MSCDAAREPDIIELLHGCNFAQLFEQVAEAVGGSLSAVGGRRFASLSREGEGKRRGEGEG